MSLNAAQTSEFAEFYHSLMQRLGDEGSALAVFKNGECLLNLVSGESSPGVPWRDDTQVICYSACKGALAMAISRLVTRTDLSYGDTLARWLVIPPEHALSSITVGQLLSHQSGMVAFHDRLAEESIYHYEDMCRAALRELPWFQKPTLAYSPFLWGWLVSQLIEAVTGEPFEHSVSGVSYGKLGDDETLAVLTPNRAALKSYRTQSLKRSLGPNGKEMTRSAFMNPSSLMVGHNAKRWTSSMIPAASGRASAFGLAGAYAEFLTVTVKDTDYSPAKTIIHGPCKTTQTEMAFSYGFMRPQGTIDTQFGSMTGGFGHSGAGGSFGFADIKHDLAVAYVTRSLGQAMFLDQRGAELIERLYLLLEIDNEL
ncbi:serine hydrolase domain-containing protein [uncultured Umboniibacter sp.]|uniref:serine hydrolase domain-containing protein n=1 Tax=uncultured Umboniibacter sp. TaxID=1798917 RepID=UPI002617A6B0|nr:serine hydrolase domain-containing protein [uncultured Umboniibacter sp.]